MKWLEVYFWTLVYWALYLCLAGIVTLVTGIGGLLEILVTGLLMTIVVVICLSQLEGVLFFDFDTPEVVLTEPSPQPEPVLSPEVIPTPAKHGRKAKKTEQKLVEVFDEEKNEFVEPGPAMHTDVNLSQLTADDVLS